jgi:hypothetical protein
LKSQWLVLPTSSAEFVLLDQTCMICLWLPHSLQLSDTINLECMSVMLFYVHLRMTKATFVALVVVGARKMCIKR